MSGLITPPGGYSPAAQASDSLSSALATIRGTPPAAVAASAAQAGPDYQNTPIPQLSGQEAALQAMFAHDQGLAAQYANPNVNGAPPANNPAGFAASPLQATVDSITNPQGAVTPQGLTGLMQGTVGGQKSTLNDIINSMDFSQARSDKAYEGMMTLLGNLVGQDQQNKRQTEQLRAQYGGIIPGMDTSTGNPGDDYVDAFMTGQVSLLDIPSQYRTYVNKKLKDMGTTAQKVQDTNASTINAINIMQEMEKKWNSMSQAEKLIPQNVLGLAPFLSPTRSGITSEFYTTLEPEIRKASVGGRITQQEIAWIRNAVLPSSLDTPESAAAKVQGVINGLQMKMKNPKMNLSQLNPTDLATGDISGHIGSGTPRLQDPKTGKVYEYDSTKDPEYVSDLSKGFRPQ